MINRCPHCGGRLDAEGSLEIGKWRLWPSFAELDGKRLKLTAAEASVLYTLAEARGGAVSPCSITQRFTKAENPKNSLRVIIARLRKKIGAQCPVETIQGRGYRWRSIEQDGNELLLEVAEFHD